MKLHVSVDTKPDTNLRFTVSQCAARLTVKLSAPSDLASLVEFAHAVYNGDPIELSTESGPFVPGPGFCRVKLCLPYTWSQQKLTTGETYEQALQTIGLLDVSSWIPESFSISYPNRTRNIIKQLTKLLDVATSYNSKTLIITFLDGAIVSLSTGFPKDCNIIDPYAVFAMPVEIEHERLVEIQQAEISTRYSELAFSCVKTRAVIGRDYFRFGPYEMSDNDFSLLLHTKNLEDAAKWPASVTKVQLFDRPLHTLIHDDTNVGRLKSLFMDVTGSTREYSFSSSLKGTGLVFNMNKFDPCKYFNRIKFGPGELQGLRDELDQNGVYLRSTGGVYFNDHTEKKAKKITLTTFAHKSLGVMAKSDAKKETEEKTFKTRVYTSVQSYLLSLCYSVILHNDLRLPENCHLDTFNFRKILTSKKRENLSSDVFDTEKYLAENTVVMTPERKLEIDSAIDRFVADFNKRKMTVSLLGNSSVITDYFYVGKLPGYYNNAGREYCWLNGLDSSAYTYLGRHFAGFARGKSNGMNKETQAISQEYLLKALRYTDDWTYDPWWTNNVSRIPVVQEEADYQRELRRKTHEFYLNNCIPNSTIESMLDDAARRDLVRFEFPGAIDIKYQEIFTLEDDSITILREGHKCKDFVSLFGWWSFVYQLIKAKSAADQKIKASDRVFVNYLLESTNIIVTSLTDKVDYLI